MGSETSANSREGLTGERTRWRLRSDAVSLRNLRPRVAKRNGPIEHERARARVGIDAEVAQPLELDARADRERGGGRLGLCVADDFEGTRIHVVHEGSSVGNVLRVFDRK